MFFFTILATHWVPFLFSLLCQLFYLLSVKGKVWLIVYIRLFSLWLLNFCSPLHLPFRGAKLRGSAFLTATEPDSNKPRLLVPSCEAFSCSQEDGGAFGTTSSPPPSTAFSFRFSPTSIFPRFSFFFFFFLGLPPPPNVPNPYFPTLRECTPFLA